MLSQQTYKPQTLLGNSNTIKTGTDGCLLFAYADGIGIDPIELNERMKPNGFVGANIIHNYLQTAIPGLKITHLLHDYNNEEVKKCLAEGKKVVVYVNATDQIGAPMHWVRYLGNGKMYDPWSGKIEPTGKYPTTVKFVAFTVPESLPVTPQPPVTVDTTLKLREALNAKIDDIGVRDAYLADFTLLVDDVIKYKGEVDDKNIIIRQKDEWINSQGKTIIEYVDDVGRLRKELVDKEKAFAKSMDHTVSTHVNELLVQEGKYKELSDQLKVCQSQKPKNWIAELIDIIRDTWKKRREQ